MAARGLDRRTFLRGAGVVGASVATPALLGGCGRDDDDALTFFFGAQPEEEKVRLRIIEAFRREHPEIRIRTQLAGPDPLQQMLTACAGGRCPDVMMAWELTYSGLAERGVLLDLNEELDKTPAYKTALRQDSSETLYDTFAFDGGQYALPEQFAGVFLYWNKKLFAEAGLEPPPARWEQAWTFDDFLEAARALTKRDRAGDVVQWGFVDPWQPYLSAGVFGMNNGVEWFSPSVDPKLTNMGDDDFIEGFQFYADLAITHGVAPMPADNQAVSALDRFLRGEAGMALVGHWMYPAFTGAADLDFDVAVLPKGPNADIARSDVGTTGLAIAAESPRKEQAWEFVKFATGPAGQAIIAESGLFIPVLTSAANSEGFRKAHTEVRNLEVFTGALQNANNLPVTPAWGKIETLIAREANQVLRGAGSARSFKDGLAADIDDLLSAV